MIRLEVMRKITGNVNGEFIFAVKSSEYSCCNDRIMGFGGKKTIVRTLYPSRKSCVDSTDIKAHRFVKST
jgi:hypothetical protein